MQIINGTKPRIPDLQLRVHIICQLFIVGQLRGSCDDYGGLFIDNMSGIVGVNDLVYCHNYWQVSNQKHKWPLLGRYK